MVEFTRTKSMTKEIVVEEYEDKFSPFDVLMMESHVSNKLR